MGSLFRCCKCCVEGLSVIGNSVEEEFVVLLLANLPESLNMLVTALKANTVIPSMNNEMECLLCGEINEGAKQFCTKAMTSCFKKSIKCYQCGKMEPIKHNCCFLCSENRKSRHHQGKKHCLMYCDINLKHQIDVSVGDGCLLIETGRGIIRLKMELPNKKVKIANYCMFYSCHTTC